MVIPVDDSILKQGDFVCEGRYEILSTLGQGGMGVVYKARSVALKRTVAIKMLTHIDADLMRRLSREAKVLASVDHPAVVQIYDFVESGTMGPMLVLEYVPGRDLGTLFGAPMAVDQAVDLMLAICSGVAACHRHHIIHRDIKPSNIRITEGTDWRTRVKILDFGIAIPHDSPIRRAQLVRITHAGVIPGTPNFTAPEILRGEEPDERCDQYGIAILLYTALTGREPFPDFEGQQLIQAVLQGNYVAPRLLRPNIPRALAAVLTQALDKDPRTRFASVVDFAFALLPFASAKANALWTHHFTRAKRPVAQELLEPVSAAKPTLAPGVVPVMQRIEPLDQPSVVAFAKPEPAPTPRPPVRAPSAPAQDPPRPRRVPDETPSDPPVTGHTLRAFVAGVAVGITLCLVLLSLGAFMWRWYESAKTVPAPTTTQVSAPAPQRPSLDHASR